MSIEEKTVCTCTCNKCHYEWQTRTERIPKACPHCKNYKWDEVKKEKGTGALRLKAGIMDASKLAISKVRK